MWLRPELVLVMVSWSGKAEGSDKFLASEFEILSDVLESVIFGVILRNDSVTWQHNAENVSGKEGATSEEIKAEEYSGSGVTLNEQKKSNPRRSETAEKETVKWSITRGRKSRKRIKNIFHSGNLKTTSNPKIVTRKIQRKIQPKFFQSTKIKSKRHNSKANTTNKNIKKKLSKQSSISNEVESRLEKIKRLFDSVQQRKNIKNQKTEPITKGRHATEVSNIKTNNLRKHETEKPKGDKIEALEKLFEIAGDEWMKNNMR